MKKRQRQFGKYVRSKRELRGISLRHFAGTIRVDPSLLSRLENGQVDPRLSMLEKLARGFEEPLSLFVSNSVQGESNGSGSNHSQTAPA